jgi:hypothetical protein
MAHRHHANLAIHSLTFLALNPFFSLWPIRNTPLKKTRCRFFDLRNAARLCHRLYPVRHDFPDGSKRRTYLLTRAPAAGVFFCRLSRRPRLPYRQRQHSPTRHERNDHRIEHSIVLLRAATQSPRRRAGGMIRVSCAPSPSRSCRLKSSQI